MSKLFLRLLLFVLLIAAFRLFTNEPSAAQSPPVYFYYYEGARVALDLNPTLVAVRFKPDTTAAARRDAARATGELDDFDGGADLPFAAPAFVPVRTGGNPHTAIQKLKQRAEVQAAGLVFQFPDGAQYGETDEFIARFKPSVAPQDVIRFNQSNDVELAREQPFSNGTLILRPRAGNPHNARALANAYVEAGKVEFAEPNFVMRLPRLRGANPPSPAPATPIVPNDPSFDLQWWLKNTRQFYGSIAGADINAPNAWSITKGASNLKIAIIDEGIDPLHLDLWDKLLAGYNALDGSGNFTPTGNDHHGTATAGIAAASTSNALGVAGVCWFCKILPVKVAQEDAQGNWITTPAQLAAGIDWAWLNGADVLSNSWTMSAPSSDVTTAIINARFGGRGGFGSTVVFAAGNNNASAVSYPASLNSYVIAVGASNWCDQRRTPTNDACNNNDPSWGSNYGGGLDLLAPGLAIYTTCNGASCPSGYAYMPGTSAATPMVAGAAALLYALSPNLTPAQVQTTLQNGAKDIASNGKDDFTGYGRLDTYRAINALYGLAVSIADNRLLLRVGDTVQYAINYSNTGITAMGSTVLDVTLPAGLDYTSSNPPFTPRGGGVYRLNLGTFASNSNGAATLTAQVAPGSAGQALVTTTQIGGAFLELNMSDNIASDRDVVVATDLFLPLTTR